MKVQKGVTRTKHMGLIETDFEKVFRDTEYLNEGIRELSTLKTEKLDEQMEEISPFWKDASSVIFCMKQTRLCEDFSSEILNLKAVFGDIVMMCENLKMAERYGCDVGIRRNY